MSAASSDSWRAGDPSRSAWVSANAGTGKTYTLANRVTRLLLDGAPPERILCLTYTKAAAAEMAGRLFKQLGEWAMLDDAVLSKRITEIGAPMRNADELNTARRLFALALETPGGLKIQTIHSFCQNLLSRFPLEAGIPPSFQVLDEQTAGELAAEAKTRVLARAGSGSAKLAKAVAEIVGQSDELKLQAILGSALGNDRRKFERLLEKYGGELQALLDAVRSAHGLDSPEYYETIAASFCAEMCNERERLHEIVVWLAAGKTSDVDLSERLACALRTNRFDDFVAALLTGEGTLRAQLATKALIAENGRIYASLVEIASRFKEAERRCRTARAAVLAEASLVLAHSAYTEYAAAKRLRAALDYDDLIGETLKLLEDRDAAAWVLYKLDGGLDHILIDEGQDTSPEQWRIIQLLAEEFFAGRSAREDRCRTIFVVGDEKQSIFSFQGADPVQFEVHREYFAQKSSSAGQDFAHVRLSTSRRSAPEILAFVDEVFGSEAIRHGVASDNAKISHSAYRAEARGRVEFWPTIKPIDMPEPDLWQRPVDLLSPADPVVRLAMQLANRIRSWTDGHSCLPDRARPIAPGDIMVLMPRREPFASELIRQLKQRGVPVAGADRIRLKEQIAAMDLIALGRFALLSEDDLTLAVVLRSPLVGLSEDALLSLSADRKGNLWSELLSRGSECESFQSACAFLTECLARADYSPPFEFYAHVLGTRDRRRRLLARLGTEAGDVIDEFLSLALMFENLNPPSLEGFLDWIEKGDAEIKRDMERGRNEVRVMTVHGAKGLEADIVILPDTTASPLAPNRRNGLIYTDECAFFPLPSHKAPDVVEEAKRKEDEEILKEHRRLLYVALTRPRDQLHVCGFEGKRKVPENSWYRLMEPAARRLVLGEPSSKPLVIGSPIERNDQLRNKVEASQNLPEWIRKPAPGETEAFRPIRPSLPADDGATSALTRPGSRELDRGLLLHTMLAQLPELVPEKRAEAAQRFLCQRGVPAAQAANLADECLRVLEHPEFASVFSPKSRSEVAVAVDLPELGPHVRVSGRIDRLAVTSESVFVLDLKTDREAPDTPSKARRAYVRQMALYRAALAKIFPGKRVECALLWTAVPVLMILPPDILQTEMEQIRTRA